MDRDTRTATRKVPLRSVCRNGDTIAAIKLTVDHVATPLRVRLLDFLRHLVVCLCDPSFKACEECERAWRQHCGAESARPDCKFDAALLSSQVACLMLIHFPSTQCAPGR